MFRSSNEPLKTEDKLLFWRLWCQMNENSIDERILSIKVWPPFHYDKIFRTTKPEKLLAVNQSPFHTLGALKRIHEGRECRDRNCRTNSRDIIGTFICDSMPRRDNIRMDVISGTTSITRNILMNMIHINVIKTLIGIRNISSIHPQLKPKVVSMVTVAVGRLRVKIFLGTKEVCRRRGSHICLITDKGD